MIVVHDDSMSGMMSDEEQRSITSCINTIAATAYGTVPFARSMGLKQMLPRNNSELAKNEYATELAEAIEEWEGRVAVKEVVFSEDREAKVVIEYDGQFD